jgi:hypothetical protein
MVDLLYYGKGLKLDSAAAEVKAVQQQLFWVAGFSVK